MFAVSYDTLKRKMLGKNIKLNKLVTAQIGTPDYETYANLFVMPENDTIHMQVEDDKKTYTFYTISTIPTPQPTTKEATVPEATTTEPTPLTPGYEVIKTVHENERGIVQQVKLSQKHVARVLTATGTPKYVQSDYVHYATATITKTDEHGSFTYEETAISLTDEEGEFNAAYVYLVPRVLTLEEAMFAIGEI